MNDHTTTIVRRGVEISQARVVLDAWSTAAEQRSIKLLKAFSDLQSLTTLHEAHLVVQESVTRFVGALCRLAGDDHFLEGGARLYLHKNEGGEATGRWVGKHHKDFILKDLLVVTARECFWGFSPELQDLFATVMITLIFGKQLNLSPLEALLVEPNRNVLAFMYKTQPLEEW